MKIALLSLAVSLALTASPALAGWGTNGQYGNVPTTSDSSGSSSNSGGGYGGSNTGTVWNNGGESIGGGYGGNGPVWNNGDGGYPLGGSSKKVYCLAADQVANMVQQRGYLIYSINYSNGRFVVKVADQRNYPYILKFNCQGKLTGSTRVKMQSSGGKKPYGGSNEGYGGNGGGQVWGGNGGNQGYGDNGGGVQEWGGGGGGYGGSGTPNW